MKKILTLIALAVGLTILFWCASIFTQARDALSWPQTKGKMISSSLTINHLPKFLDTNADPLRWYGTQVEYEYFVNGQPYFSHRLSFQMGNTRDPKEALSVMNKYRRHKEVMVYYDPRHPEEAVLEPGDIGDIFIPLMIGGLLAVLGLISFCGQSVEFGRDVDNNLYQAQVYQDQGRWADVFWQYNQFIRVNPYLAVGYSRRGNVYLQRENWDLAIHDFNQAIGIDPNDAVTYFSLANAYLGKGQYEKAWENMNKAMDKGFVVKPEVLESIKSKLI